jgi:hypothetical protein
MTELTITELRKMAKDHNEKFIKCAEAIDKAVSAISARKDCNGVVVADGADPCNLTEPTIDSVDTTSADALRERIVNGSLYKGVPITEAEILAHRNSCRVVSGDNIISFTFDGEVPSVSDVLKLDFGFHTATEPTLMIVRYTCKKHHYFNKLKLENYVANMDDEDNKLILRYDSVEEKVLMVEDGTIDISVGLDGKISSDDMAEIIYSNTTKLI